MASVLHPSALPGTDLNSLPSPGVKNKIKSTGRVSGVEKTIRYVVGGLLALGASYVGYDRIKNDDYYSKQSEMNRNMREMKGTKRFIVDPPRMKK